MKKGDIGRIEGIIRIDELNSHVPREWEAFKDYCLFITPEMQNINEKMLSVILFEGK